MKKDSGIVLASGHWAMSLLRASDQVRAMNDLVDVTGTPYYLDAADAGAKIQIKLADLAEHVELLRRRGALTQATLQTYYRAKRFEQIAESNALEGSTLSAGETELAVLRGVTVTGHDPAFSRDAQALARALDRLVELARDRRPTSCDELKQLHELIVGGRPGSGVFRSTEVRIRGSAHRPPTTWRQVMDGMEQWERWSLANDAAAPLLRAAVLHAWLTHVHPFVDGNGRTSRAVSNLELIRAGYPPVILRHKDRDRYLDALGAADQGELGPFLDLLIQRAEDSLRELERAASKAQGYSYINEKRRRVFESRLAIWNAGVHLLVEMLRAKLAELLDGLSGASTEVKEFDELKVDDLMELSSGRPVGQSWAFRVTCAIPSGQKIVWLCWAGFPDRGLQAELAKVGSDEGRPALMWSLPTASYPPWRKAGAEEGPGIEQMTIAGDRWLLWSAGRVVAMSVTDLADKLAKRAAEAALPSEHL